MPAFAVEFLTEEGPRRAQFTLDPGRELGPQVRQILVLAGSVDYQHQLIVTQIGDHQVVQNAAAFVGHQHFDDQEQMRLVFLELGPLIGIGDIFQQQGMKAEHFSESLQHVHLVDAPDVHPADSRLPRRDRLVPAPPGDGKLRAHAVVELVGVPASPVVFTGAMRPWELRSTDALQNLTEAVFGAGVLPPGVYCVAHGRALRFPGVTKDKVRRTFTGG